MSYDSFDSENIHISIYIYLVIRPIGYLGNESEENLSNHPSKDLAYEGNQNLMVFFIIMMGIVSIFLLET